MRLYTFIPPSGRATVGAETSDGLIELPAAAASLGSSGLSGTPHAGPLPDDMLGFIRAGAPALAAARAILARSSEPALAAACHRFDRVTLCAPIPRPGKILCCGLNYRSHVEENPAAKFLEDPRFFAKVPSTVIGPGEPIRHPGLHYQVDYEVELAVVYGSTACRVSQAAAMAHVFGFTILHDVSARWLQFKENNEMLGKNFDTFAPIGPCIVTADEIPDPAALRLSLQLNGEVMQDRTNADWCFPLPRLIERLSSVMTLEPGDIMTTGTPAGIGYFRKPQVFLKPGDVCRLEVERIGVLENRVVAI